MHDVGGSASLLVLLVSVLLGAVAIHVGASFGLRRSDFRNAVITAVLGGVAWAIVDAVAGGVLHLPGQVVSLVALVVWAWVIRWRYQVGWIRAALIGIGAWIVALLVLAGLDILGVDGLDAYGVPGT